jgi:hypothetical protein
VYTANPNDKLVNPEAARYVTEALGAKFGSDKIWYDGQAPKASSSSFPVRMHDGRIIDSTSLSPVMEKGLVNHFDYVFVEKSIKSAAIKFIIQNRADIIKPRGEDQ